MINAAFSLSIAMMVFGYIGIVIAQFYEAADNRNICAEIIGNAIAGVGVFLFLFIAEYMKRHALI